MRLNSGVKKKFWLKEHSLPIPSIISVEFRLDTYLTFPIHNSKLTVSKLIYPMGSIKTSDTSFRQRYNRGYFSYTVDTIKHEINFKKCETDSTLYNGVILSMNYQLPDSNTIQLWAKQRNDSLYVLLKRSNRHFQLAEK